MNNPYDPLHLSQLHREVLSHVNFSCYNSTVPAAVLALLSNISKTLSHQAQNLESTQYRTVSSQPLRRALARDLGIPMILILHLLTLLECDLSDLYPWLLSIRSASPKNRPHAVFTLPLQSSPDDILSPSHETGEKVTLFHSVPIQPPADDQSTPSRIVISFPLSDSL